MFGYAEPNNGNSSATIDPDLVDLDLPEPLSPEQKRALRTLIQERLALMKYCILTSIYLETSLMFGTYTKLLRRRLGRPGLAKPEYREQS